MHECILTTVLLAMSAWTLGCGGGGAGSVTQTSPPPPSITISVTPITGTVLLGETLSFTASVSNSDDTSVSWSVNSIAGGSAQVGTISADGIYTAPPDLSSGGTVQVTATSQADASKSASASVSISSDVAILLTPNAASVELGAQQSMVATVQSQGRPDTRVRWSLSGAACPNACGTVDANGTYTAPQILPASAVVTLTAASVADPTKQRTARLTITSHFSLQLSAPTTLGIGSTSTLIATLTPVAGSNPSLALSWALSGSGCTGSGCGALNVTTTQASGGTPLANTATYTAPITAPQPNSVTITVISQADPSKQVQANITIQAGGSIGISPASATVAANGRITLTASQGNGAGGGLNWSVNGIAGGNSTFGEICVTGSSPCQPYSSGSALQVDYVAPGSIPSPNPFLVTVSSTTNASLSSSAAVTVINHVVVSVLPNNVTLAPTGVQSFAATVLGTTNQNVIWQIQGTGCGMAGSCGTIDASGNYTAPATPPNPNTVAVVATSQYDSSQSGSANVEISTQLNIATVQPASVYAGGLEGFTLQVDGSGFVPSSPGPGSTLVIGGTARVTTCTSAAVCTAPVSSSDAAQAGNLVIQVKNPNAAISNTVYIVIVLPGAAPDVIALSSSAPAAISKDIAVVEPTTAGIDAPGYSLDLNVAAIGLYSAATTVAAWEGIRSRWFGRRVAP